MFIATLNQMLFLFCCILVGYVLKKKNLLGNSSESVISKLENLILIPCLLIKSFYTNCTIESLSNNLDLLLYGLLFVVIQVIIAYLCLPLFKANENEKGIFVYSMSVVNFSFMGNSLVNALFGSEMLYKYLIFSMPLNILAFSIGYVWLSGSKFSFKKLINPIVVSMLIGIVLGLSGIKLPLFVENTINNLANCFSPLAMVLTGLVIGGYDIKKLFTNKRVYLLTIIRCLILPLILLYACKFIGLKQDIITLLIFICAMPLGLNTIVVPSAFGKDTTLGASMALVSNILGLVSVPMFLALFVV